VGQTIPGQAPDVSVTSMMNPGQWSLCWRQDSEIANLTAVLAIFGRKILSLACCRTSLSL
jgi:hypothetical protein